MKNCKWCQTLIKEQAKICPQCKKDLRNWLVRHPILSIIILLLILLIIDRPSSSATNNSFPMEKEVYMKPAFLGLKMFLISKSTNGKNPVGIFRIQYSDGTSYFKKFEASCGKKKGRDILCGVSTMKDCDVNGFYNLSGYKDEGSISYNQYLALCY